MNRLFLICFGMALLTLTTVYAVDRKTEPVTEAGQCYSNLGKTYLSDPNSRSGQVLYQCSYYCFDSSGKRSEVKANATADAARAAAYGNEMVCDGVIVKQKNVGEMLIWDFDHVEAFWAVESTRPEILAWAQKSGADLSPSEFSARMQKFRSTMASLAGSYGQVAGNDAFLKASIQASEISRDSREGRKLLKRHLTTIAEAQLAGKRLEIELSPDAIIRGALTGNARFLVGMRIIGSSQLNAILQ